MDGRGIAPLCSALPFAYLDKSKLFQDLAALYRTRRLFCYAKPASTDLVSFSATQNDPNGVAMRGGEGEIRTRGELPHDSFQDCYLKPLGHLSVVKYSRYHNRLEIVHQVGYFILQHTSGILIPDKHSRYLEKEIP